MPSTDPSGGDLILRLPYPPSANRYWRRAGRRIHVSREGADYKIAASWEARIQGATHPREGRVGLTVVAFPPDKRSRDIDNALKILLDALEGTVYRDDAQIDSLSIYRGPPFPPLGRVVVRVSEPEDVPPWAGTLA